MLSVATDQIAAAEQQIGAFGLMIVTDKAAAAGVASIPGPITDIGDDWFVYVPIVQQLGFATATGFNPGQGVHYPIDSKAKRILEGSGKVIAVVVENIHASFAFEIAFVMRILTQTRGTR